MQILSLLVVSTS
uniref:Uncharacterized protein n=1 Tax=Rhizophora mucronata TaxID=61149 RepID=A0A2P2QG52_RHIMU